MIYFYKSSRKNELTNPITILAQNERRAFALALVNFLKNELKGSPKLIAV